MSSSVNESEPNTLLNKVPEVTLAFWIVKILCTTVGETGADYLQFNLGLGIETTAILATMMLGAALVWQVSRRRCIPAIYWLAVLLVSVVGTLLSDYLVDNLGVSLETSTAFFGGLMLAAFALWYAAERTLSIHTIFTQRRELYYWFAILLAFALGTSAGDLFAEGFAIGYAPAAALFGIALAVTYAAYLMGAGAVLTFWVGYVLTRPFGASMGDLMSQSKDAGGLGFGPTATSELFLILIAGLVAWLSLVQLRQDASDVKRLS